MSKTLEKTDNPIDSDHTHGSKCNNEYPSVTPRIIDCSFELMTESEVIHFLRIPEISGSKNYHNVIEHLKKFRGLPRIHICRKALYPKKAILEWVDKEVEKISDIGK